ncbi:MAG TPA: hypothetical protein VE173_02395, partial [Longimicrobiales bacterium]|nr:hypothetical protein [Longimicrobiales bacterium]
MFPSADIAVVARAALVLLIAAGACAEGAPREAVTSRDSAGVQITTVRDEPGRIFATVDPTPVLSLGGARARGARQFYQVQTVWVDGDGNVWVVDGQSAQLRIFRLDGTHWKMVGGRGEGPGEFRQPRLLGSFRGDSVAVWDQGNARLTVLDRQAEIRRITRLEVGDRAAPVAYDVFPDGSLLVQFPRPVPPSQPGTILRDTVRLERLDLGGERSRPVAGAEGPLWLWTGRNQVPVPFTIHAAFDLEDARIHLVSGPDFRVRVYEEGELREIYGVDRPPRDVEGSDLNAYARRIEDLYPKSEVGEYLGSLDQPERPSL